jgi:hypothetical protein
VRLTFYNDTGRKLSIHAGSVRPTPPADAVELESVAVFELPDDAEPFVKVWSNALIVLDMKRRNPSPS